MQTYQATPDYYRDYIEHGWLKDQAAKVHKYIKRWKNAAGKWVYQYKKPESHIRINSIDTSDSLKNQLKYPGRISEKSHEQAARRVYLTRYGNISRARNNAKNAYIKKGTPYSGSSSYRKSGNLTSRGYSGSQGSGEAKRLRNVGTRKSVKSRVTKSNMTNKVRRGQAMGTTRKRYDSPNENTKAYMYHIRKRRTIKRTGDQFKKYSSPFKRKNSNAANNFKRSIGRKPSYIWQGRGESVKLASMRHQGNRRTK